MGTVILKEQDYNSDLGNKIRETGAKVIMDDDTISPNITQNCLIIDPMPTSTSINPESIRNNIDTNIINLLQHKNSDVIIRPTFWHIDIDCYGDEAEIHISDEKLDEIKTEMEQGKFDYVISAGASADHIDFDKFKNLDKLKSVFNAATKNTGGLLTICWSSMVAFNNDYGTHKHVDANEKGKLYKILGHFETNMTDKGKQSEYAKGLSKIRALPLGCTGYLKDTDLWQLEAEGKIEILATNPSKNEVASDSSIAIAISNNTMYWGPHPDYKWDYALSEAKRDKGYTSEPPQEGVIIEKVIGMKLTDDENEEVIGTALNEEDHYWLDGASVCFQQFSINALVRVGKIIRNTQTKEKETISQSLQIIEANIA